MPVTTTELIDRGDTRTLTVQILASDVLVDPSALTLTIRTPAGVSTIYTYGVGSEITRDSTGVYHRDVTFTEAGAWTYEWHSTTPTQVQGDIIEVQPSPIDSAPITLDAVALTAFRLELGDTDPDDELYTDEQAQYFLDGQPGSILLAVADACDALARRFAREFDFATTSEKRFDRSQKAKAYRDAATELRARAKLDSGGAVSVIVTTRADAYSDDLDTRETRGLIGASGRARLTVYDGDVFP